MNTKKFKLECQLYNLQSRASGSETARKLMTPGLKREFNSLACMRGTAKNAATKAIGFRNHAELQAFEALASMRRKGVCA